MKTHKAIGSVLTLVVAIPMLVDAEPALAQQQGTPEVVAAELSTVARQLQLNPKMAIDFSDVSGEYCFDAGFANGGHMHHLAIDPKKTKEDVVEFINAKPLMDAGLDVSKLPRHPGKLNAMEPNKWYYLPAGEYEPHHGMEFPFPLLLKAIDVA